LLKFEVTLLILVFLTAFCVALMAVICPHVWAFLTLLVVFLFFCCCCCFICSFVSLAFLFMCAVPYSWSTYNLLSNSSCIMGYFNKT